MSKPKRKPRSKKNDEDLFDLSFDLDDFKLPDLDEFDFDFDLPDFSNDEDLFGDWSGFENLFDD